MGLSWRQFGNAGDLVSRPGSSLTSLSQLGRFGVIYPVIEVTELDSMLPSSDDHHLPRPMHSRLTESGSKTESLLFVCGRDM